MIRVAARRSDGTKLKLNAPVNSLEEAWDLLHAELKANKIPAGALVAIQLTQSKQTGGGLQVLGEPRRRRRVDHPGSGELPEAAET
jgi:hypothetical protein